MSSIHVSTKQIRVGYSYTFNPKQDILFVINDKTTKEEITNLIKFCSAFGLEYNFWDISVNEHLNLYQPLGVQYSPDFLAKDFKDKTIVLFDADIQIESANK